jgi:hypothetical protein
MARYCVGPATASAWEEGAPVEINRRLVGRAFGYFLPYWRRALLSLLAIAVGAVLDLAPAGRATCGGVSGTEGTAEPAPPVAQGCTTGQRKSAPAARVTETSPAAFAAATASSDVSRYGVTPSSNVTRYTCHAPPW